MNAFGTLFVLLNAAAILLLPLRWAPLPLLLGACYMTLGQGIELGPLNFPIIRILIAVGLLRVLASGKAPAGGLNGMDGAMLAWALWAVLSSLFHEEPAASLVNRLGLVYNACGIYFLLRVFCRSADDVVVLCRATAILLVPLALEMVVERFSGRNLFSALGGVPELSDVRGGTVRAQGPFLHAILAGSVGAACLPLMVAIGSRHRATAVAGSLACLAVIYTSGSSGPVLSAAIGVLALVAWPLRRHLRSIRWAIVLAYVALELVMNAPAYYALARIDVTGSSTSWHRAELVHAALTHLSEWWLIGTDHTRHWMAYGVPWSARHIDITNYYLMMGVYGGLPLMLLFIWVLVKGFSYVGRQLKVVEGRGDSGSALTIWGLGAALIAHSATMISVSYFDQSVLFLYITLAGIAGAYGAEPVPAEPGPRAGAVPVPGWVLYLGR